MPKTERPAPADSIAVLDIKLLPGRESSIDWARFFGSSAGKLDACLSEVREVNRAGEVLNIVVT